MALRDVELVEDRPDPPGGAAPPASRPRRRRRLLVAVALVLVVAVAAAVLSEVRARRDDAARAAALQALPGVLRPLDPALPVAVRGARSWEDEESLPLRVLTHVAGVEAGEVVVVGVSGPDGNAVVGARPGDDDERWRTPVPPPADLAPATAGWVWCSTPEAGTGRALMRAEDPDAPVGCVAEWFGAAEQAADGTTTTRSRTVLLEVDPADGRVLHRVDLPTGASGARTADGWATAAVAGQTLTVQGLAPDGSVRWSTALDVGDVPVADEWTILLGAPERVLVQRGDGVWVLDAADGSVRAELPGVRVGQAWLLPGGLLLRDVDGAQGPDALHLPDGTLHGLDGERAVPADLDDGSLGDVLVTTGGRGDGRTTLRRTDGTVLWRADGLRTRAAAVVDGTVVVVDGDRLVRLDGDDGRVRWEVPLGRDEADPVLLTDGSLLLVGTAAALHAWTYDGAHAWTAEVSREGGELRVQPGQGPAASPEPSPAGGMARWAVGREGRLVLAVTAAGAVREGVLVLG